MPEITGTNKEQYDKNVRRREKLSGYYFDMSKLTFATTVLTKLGVFNGSSDWPTILMGAIATILFANIGNRVLKF